MRVLRSSRTIEYYVLLSLRTIEKRRLDLNRLSIWTGVFCTSYRELRAIECTYYREMGLLHGCTQDLSLAQSASSYSVTCSPITSLQEQQLAELRNTTYQPWG